MLQWLLKKFLGSKNERDVRRLRPAVERINALEEEYQSLTDEALVAKTEEFRKRLAEGATLDDLLPEAFAVVKNACRRLCGRSIEVTGSEQVWDMVPFDVQLIGGMVLHQGKIAEMATGEGKTLVATLPVYLNALPGKGVHVVTVNDYLARRDSEWMGAVYRFLGLTVGCIQHDMDPATRREHYGCDITYGTNAEFGFDYLRDNMAWRPDDMVQRGFAYAIVDEIDSILIDEARTPLIISGPAPYSVQHYGELKPAVERLVSRQRELCNRFADEVKQALEKDDEETALRRLYQIHQGMPKHKQLLKLIEEPAVRRRLEKVDNMMLTEAYKAEARGLREELFFTIDEKGHDASLTDKGCAALDPDDPDTYVVPDLASEQAEVDAQEGLTDEERFQKHQELQELFVRRSERIHTVDQLIRAYCVYEKDIQYVVQDNQVIIVDENTGRMMTGRRWSDGLHQAVEAKENVKVQRETQTLATITIQNYFRMYDKLAGMTGTAETEADEFFQIYKLDVIVIPTNRPVRRVDGNDLVYKTQREKFNAIIDEIADCHQRGQPVLVGTISVEASELLSRMLRRRNIPHNVLNAKNHAREAEIVTRAGQKGAVTIATNMAGRGTDIKLGEGVIWIDRSLITGQTALEDKVEERDGKKVTLLELLEEKPCGLHVIGSERHESRRIDRQLRGRCARQGDPGSSRFYISLEDDLMRLFGSDRISGVMERLGIQEGEVLEHPWLNRSIGTAQRRVEQHNFSIRKRTLEYDDVLNQQRDVIYGFRAEVLRSENLHETLSEIVADVVDAHVEDQLDPDDEVSVDQFVHWANGQFPIGLKPEHLPSEGRTRAALAEVVIDKVRQAYELKARHEDPANLLRIERGIILQAVDTHWQEYLRNLDAVRQGVGLRAYGQRDPLVEYKKEAYELFGDLMDRIKADIAHAIFRSASSFEAFQRFLSALPQQTIHQEVAALGAGSAGAGARGAAPRSAAAERAMQAAMRDAAAAEAPEPRSAPTPVVRDTPRVGRNDPCPCGSGKKYKKCCGAG